MFRQYQEYDDDYVLHVHSFRRYKDKNDEEECHFFFKKLMRDVSLYSRVLFKQKKIQWYKWIVFESFYERCDECEWV